MLKVYGETDGLRCYPDYRMFLWCGFRLRLCWCAICPCVPLPEGIGGGYWISRKGKRSEMEALLQASASPLCCSKSTISWVHVVPKGQQTVIKHMVSSQQRWGQVTSKSQVSLSSCESSQVKSGAGSRKSQVLNKPVWIIQLLSVHTKIDEILKRGANRKRKKVSL